MSESTKGCKIEWIEIPAPDLDAARSFYANVFQWNITQYAEDYLVFHTANLHGGLRRNKRPSIDGISFSITVEDIPAALAAILQYGGKVVTEKYQIGEGLGYCAAFLDPNGNRIEVWSEE